MSDWDKGVGLTGRANYRVSCSRYDASSSLRCLRRIRCLHFFRSENVKRQVKLLLWNSPALFGLCRMFPRTMDTSLLRPKFLSFLHLSSCWLVLSAPQIFRGAGLFDGATTGLVRSAKKESVATETASHLLYRSFSALPSGSSTALPGAGYYPFSVAYAFAGEEAPGQAGSTDLLSLGEDKESYVTNESHIADEGPLRDGETEVPVTPSLRLSAGRPSQQTRSVTGGVPKNIPRALASMLAVTVGLVLISAHMKYNKKPSPGPTWPKGVLPTSMSDRLEKLTGAAKNIFSGMSRTTRLIIGVAMILSSLIATQLLRKPEVNSWEPLGLLERPARGAGSLNTLPAADAMQLAAVMSTVAAAVIPVLFVLRRRRRYVEPEGEKPQGEGQARKPAGEEATDAADERDRKKAEEQERARSDPPAGLLLRAVPGLLDVLENLDEAKKQKKDTAPEPVYHPGSPEVQELQEKARLVLVDLDEISPPLHNALAEQVTALEKSPPGLAFEEHVRRLITVFHRAQLVLVRRNLYEIEGFLVEGKFRGHKLFLDRQLRSYLDFLQDVLPGVDRNFKSTVSILEHRLPKKKRQDLVAFVNAELGVFHTSIAGLQKRLGHLLSFTDSDGTVMPGLKDRILQEAKEDNGKVTAAVQAVAALVKPEFPREYVSWLDGISHP
ncbi:hypothetical protein CSUI_004969 [Cystoisospora suis]|uniref:Transmembrane protein n=1 Tax=Cystoisospora suis TaxID=483139 RepID=A0A2C6KZ64_9APIC|nr:hypothetical protein CSUI_004969 [Cystoisospora suis]